MSQHCGYSSSEANKFHQWSSQVPPQNLIEGNIEDLLRWITRLGASLFFFTLFHFIQRQRMCDFTREEGRGGACSCNYDYEGGTSQPFGLPPRQLMSPYLPLWFSPFGQKRRRRRRRRRNVYHVRFCASDDPAGHWREKGGMPCPLRPRTTTRASISATILGLVAAFRPMCR